LIFRDFLRDSGENGLLNGGKVLIWRGFLPAGRALRPFVQAVFVINME
jgi:hypothetical protein